MRSTKSPGLVGFGFLFLFFFLTVPAMAQERPDFPNDDNRNPYELNQTLDSHGNTVRDQLTHRKTIGYRKTKVNRNDCQ
jgi:hypothetical protein